MPTVKTFPLFRAASTTFRASACEVAKGLSRMTCLPASRAAIANDAWNALGTATYTASIPLSRIRSSALG